MNWYHPFYSEILYMTLLMVCGCICSRAHWLFAIVGQGWNEGPDEHHHAAEEDL